MSQRLLVVLIVCLCRQVAPAQSTAVRDSLLAKLNALSPTPDTTNVILLNALARQYALSRPDTTYLYARQAYTLARQIGYGAGEARALNGMAVGLTYLGDYAKAIDAYNRARQTYQARRDTTGMVGTLNNTAKVYMQQGEWRSGLLRLRDCYALYNAMAHPSPGLRPILLTNSAACFYNLHQLDSASMYLNRAVALLQPTDHELLIYTALLRGDVALARNDTRQALRFYQQSEATARRERMDSGLSEVYVRLATLYQQTGPESTAIQYAKQALEASQKSSDLGGVLKSSQLLTRLYRGKNDAAALRYYELAGAAKDSLYSQDRVKRLLSLTFEEQQQAQAIEAAKTDYRNTIRTYIFGTLLVLLAGIALVLYRNNRQKQLANKLLQRQRDEIHAQRTKAEKALADLQTTQVQLIQKEKLASLGELMAGIAHEIQNPLNFVTNFSEVSAELVTELQEGPLRCLPDADKENAADALADLATNLQKITHHGGRASAIVRSMLAHSRGGSGEKQPTSLNILASEALQIAYHGQRRSGPSTTAKAEPAGAFACEVITEFDPTLPLVNVVPEDLSRVLLNLFANAFYAVRQRGAHAPDGYVPTVWVRTRQLPGQVQISVADNGPGIPDAIKAKIFQPFFTTKPTGEGTGLGLSLSYDIITKGHAGTFSVVSEPGRGADFTIALSA